MKNNDLSDKDDLLIQSYFTIAFLAELNRLDFLKTDFYNSCSFQDKYVQENFPSIGIGNRGALLIFLYALLVLPKEQYKNTELENKINYVNNKIKPLINKQTSNYEKDIKNGDQEIRYIYHIRNSIAHGKVKFENNMVIFNDENTYKKDKITIKEECKFEISLENIGNIISELQMIVVEYLQSKK